jgi:hypothetical protein
MIACTSMNHVSLEGIQRRCCIFLESGVMVPRPFHNGTQGDVDRPSEDGEPFWPCHRRNCEELTFPRFKGAFTPRHHLRSHSVLS